MLDIASNPSITRATPLTELSLAPESDTVFTDELAAIFQWVTFSLLNQAVGLFGVGSNIINIICFVRQGFKDPVNVSFLGLAVADLGSLVTIIWTNLCFNPEFIKADLPFQPIEFQHLTGGTPHVTMTRISSWITALITLERCLCIIAPIKVNTIVTSKRASVIIICVFIIILGSTAPQYVVNRLAWKFNSDTNKTLIGMVFAENREQVETVSYIINNACIPFGAFTIIIVCTIIMVIQLRRKAQWRKASTVSAFTAKASTRTEKVEKMVLIISGLFLFCFTPVCAFFIAMSLVPSISIVGKHRSMIFIFGGFGTLLESINASVNIIIYYDMSSKYRAALRQLLCISDTK